MPYWSHGRKKSPCLTGLAHFLSGIQWQGLIETMAVYRGRCSVLDLSPGHLIHPDKTKGPGERTSQALLDLQPSEACLETGSKGFRSGQLCLCISVLPARSGMALLSSVCTAHTAHNSLSDTGIASHCLLGRQNHFVLLLSNVKLKVCLFYLKTACPPESVYLVL